MASRLLLDTSSLVYRAFFALPPTIADPEGRPVNAVHGYLDMVANLVRDQGADEVVHCLDADWRPAPRVAAYAGYKSTRPPDPEALPRQFEVLDEVLGALGELRATAPGWEADDVIGTLCAAAAPGAEIDIVTGDRDLLQLVRDHAAAVEQRAAVVRVLFTVRGVTQMEVFDAAGVQRRYGVPADRYVDYATLRGDPSDGLPGVRGVGEKTARELVAEYASIDELLAAAGTRSPRLAQNLKAAEGYLAAMREVVPVRADVHVDHVQSARDDDLVDRLGERHRLAGPLRRLREALDA